MSRNLPSLFVPVAFSSLAFVAGCGAGADHTTSSGAANVQGNPPGNTQPATSACDFSMCRDTGGLGERVRTGRERDYWAVFRDVEKNVHYILPRPDNGPYVAEQCGAESEVAATLTKNAFCSPSSSGSVEKMNSLTREDALAIVSFLHSKLEWRTADGLKPFPYTNDVEEVCKANPTERAGVLKSLCDYTLARVNASASTTEARTFTPQETEALLPLLNALYKISVAR